MTLASDEKPETEVESKDIVQHAPRVPVLRQHANGVCPERRHYKRKCPRRSAGILSNKQKLLLGSRLSGRSSSTLRSRRTFRSSTLRRLTALTGDFFFLLLFLLFLTNSRSEDALLRQASRTLSFDPLLVRNQQIYPLFAGINAPLANQSALSPETLVQRHVTTP